MLQVMLELGVLAQVPEADVATGRAVPGSTSAPAAQPMATPPLNILSGTSAPSDSYVAVPYKGRWFWIADTDVRSKLLFWKCDAIVFRLRCRCEIASASGHSSGELNGVSESAAVLTAMSQLETSLRP